MKLQYKSIDGRFTTQFESETETGIVEQLFDFQNLFEKNTVCGLCGNEDVFFNIREGDSGKYYERKCDKCGAAFPYHVNKDKVKKGGLYFSWKDRWAKYVPKPKDEDEDVKSTKGKGK